MKTMKVTNAELIDDGWRMDLSDSGLDGGTEMVIKLVKGETLLTWVKVDFLNGYMMAGEGVVEGQKLPARSWPTAPGWLRCTVNRHWPTPAGQSVYASIIAQSGPAWA